jgi:hypothetical protein
MRLRDDRFEVFRARFEHGEHQSLPRAEAVLDDPPSDSCSPGNFVRARAAVKAEINDALERCLNESTPHVRLARRVSRLAVNSSFYGGVLNHGDQRTHLTADCGKA